MIGVRLLLWLVLLTIPFIGDLQGARAQALGQGSDAMPQWWRVVGALLICIVLAVLAAYSLKRRLRGTVPGLRSGQRRLHLIESVRLSHQVDVCLIDCQGERFLVAVTAQGASLLGRPAVQDERP